MQPLWRAVWSFFKKLKIELPFHPSVLLLGIYPEKTETLIKKDTCWDFPVVQWLRLPSPNAGGPGLILGWGTKSHMLCLRGHTLQLKIVHGAVKTEDPVCHS